MNQIMVSVFDRAAQVFGRPVFVASKGVALRSFTDEVNRVDVNNEMNKHPDDFDLFVVGSFDDESGTLIPTAPECWARAKDVFIASK